MANGWLSAESPEKGGGNRETRWLTPLSIVQALGEFDLDPCGAPDHVLAKQTYLLENGQDGLVLPWNGRVWLNPPYDRKPMIEFMSRLAHHGNGIALIFARTETKMFHDLVWNKADAVLFLQGRITFLTADKSAAPANAGAPSCLVAYGASNVDALVDAVSFNKTLKGKVVEL